MKARLLSTALATGAGLLAPMAAAALSGTVVDSQGNPIANAAVEIVGSGRSLTTDATGRFSDSVESVDELHIVAPGYSHKVLHLHGDTDQPLRIVLHRSVMEQVDVIGLPLHLSNMESAQPISVISGDELRDKQASTLGETLKNEIGVHSSYFGPVASSPIIRGLDGPRVMITQNGLDAGDASRVGPDHVVATEAATALQIEILRGPATLFYGSGAIGGVVNIVDDRVPADSETKAAMHIAHNTVANEDEASAAFTGGSDRFAVHVDGFWRDGDDYEIPGIAERETEEEHEEEGHEPHAEGVLENSAAQGHGFNIGGSALFERGYIGLSYGRLDRLNGVPGHSAEDHGEAEETLAHEDVEGLAHEDEQVLSDLRQERWQMAGELRLDSAVWTDVKMRAGYTDYQHQEIHQAGGVVEETTLFENRTVQARVDLRHHEFSGWRGAVSVDAKSSDFEAVGAEAFTTPSTTDTVALALMEEKHAGDVLWQLGARIERVSIKPSDIEFELHHEEEAAEAQAEHLDLADQQFHPFSLSAGLVWDFADGYKFGAAYSHAERAPSASELYALGPHIGTGAFEIGALFELHEEAGELHLDYSGNTQEELSNNIDLSLRKHQGEIGFVLNAFYNRINNFFYQRDSGYHSEDILAHEEAGEEHEAHGAELPVYVFAQADATLYGVEAEAAWQLSDTLKWTVWGDSIHGELSSGAYIPRIPPKRLGSQFDFERNHWHAELSIARYFEQDNVAANETATAGYTMVDAQVSYHLPTDAGVLTFYAKGHNLGNQEARVHSSFLKDRVPLPGRGFSLGLRGRL